MKSFLGVLRRFTWMAALWSVAGAAMADDCTNPPSTLRFARIPGTGTGIGGYEVVTERQDGGVWTSEPKNPRGSGYAPFWSRNCPVPAGMGTQVIRFTLQTNNYFSSGVSGSPAHIPVFGLLQNSGAPNWELQAAGLALFPVTPHPLFSGVMWEDWDLPNPNKNLAALPNFQFQDGVLYNIQLNVTSGAMAVWIRDLWGNLLASAGANVFMFPPPTGWRPMHGGFGFAALCATPDWGGCEYASGPLQHVLFDVYIGSIQVAWVQ